MNKIFLACGIVILLAHDCWGQNIPVVISHNDLAQPGYLVYVVKDTLVEKSIVQQILYNTGCAQTWDFSFINTHETDTMEFIDASHTLHQNYFPEASVCLVKKGKDNDFYIKNNNTGLYLEGNVSNVFSSSATILQRNPPLQIVRYPFTYLDTLSSTSITSETAYYGKYVKNAVDSDFVDSVRIISTTTLSSMVDAYGVLIVPSGEFYALRQNSSMWSIKDIYEYIQGKGWTLYENQYDTTYYFKWWAKNAQYPIVECGYIPHNSRIYGLKYSSFRLLEGSGINEWNTSGIKLFPNPVTSAIQFINMPEEVSSIEIIDCMGKKIIQENINPMGQGISISMKQFKNGVYHYTLFDNKYTKITSAKFLKVN